MEDDQSVRNLISTTLKINDYSFVLAESAEEAIRISVSEKPDLVLLDLGLPDADGMEFLNFISYSFFSYFTILS